MPSQYPGEAQHAMDPISPFWQFGLGVGGVVVCTVLFIWSTLEMTRLKDSLSSVTSELAQILDAQQKFMAKISEQQSSLAINQLNLTNAVNEVVRELISIIRDVETS